MLLDDRVVAIPHNLYDALVHYSWIGYRGGPFWADALCIDQQNLHEKEAQIGMMDQIYAHATMVIAWLGLDLDPTKPSRKLLHLADFVMAHFEYDEAEDCRKLEQTESYLNPMEQFLVGRIANYLPSEDLQLVELFLSKSWFRRVWMVQEAALPLKCYFWWGDAIIAYNIVRDLLHPVLKFWQGAALTIPSRQLGLRQDEWMDVSHWKEFDQITRMFYWCHGRPGAAPFGNSYTRWTGSMDHNSAGLLLVALEQNRQRQATNPLDRVYGLLGIVNAGSKSLGVELCPILPLYELTPGQVGSVVTKFILKHIPVLSIFSLVIPDADDKKDRLPSWTLNLLNINENTLLSFDGQLVNLDSEEGPTRIPDFASGIPPKTWYSKSLVPVTN